MIRITLSATLLSCVVTVLGAQEYALENTTGLVTIDAHAQTIVHGGRTAVEVTQMRGSSSVKGEAVVLVDGPDFTNGTIEVWISGHVAPDPEDTSSRAFVGIVFRSTSDAQRFENMYLRLTNGRANDQLRRNHTVQYQSAPDYPWHRLRQETPGQYESYADVAPDVWTKMRIVVDGRRAQLYVNDAPQPCLVVNDLKGTESHGRIGLWAGPSTIAYFSHLTVR